MTSILINCNLQCVILFVIIAHCSCNITIAYCKATPFSHRHKNLLTILFVDMWEAFDPEYNMFLLAIRHTIKANNIESSFQINGVSIDDKNDDIDLVIFGPYGTKWLHVSKIIPKVHYTGENSDEIINDEHNVLLNIGFKRHPQRPNAYLRLPIWILEIDWFQADMSRMENPKLVSLQDSMHSPVVTNIPRDKFCSFIVSNPNNAVRNAAFSILNSYKPIDSAGKLFNNVGDVLRTVNNGGGGGELMKVEFQKSYRFCLTFENSRSEGYVTEKIFHAKVSGCIPIYWGDLNVALDFDKSGFLNVNEFQTSDDLVRFVETIDNDPESLFSIASIPALNITTRDFARSALAQMVRTLLYISNFTNLSFQVPLKIPKNCYSCPQVL